MLTDVSILDLPPDVILKIILMVEGEFSLHPFLNMKTNDKLRISIRKEKDLKKYAKRLVPWSSSKILAGGGAIGPGGVGINNTAVYNNSLYLESSVNNPCTTLPGNLCILSRVCKDLKDEILSGPYWETIYTRDFRNGKKYVRKKSQEFYKEEYYKLINEYFTLAKKHMLYNIELLETDIITYTYNSEKYLNVIREAVNTCQIDIPRLKFRIPNLKRICEDDKKLNIITVINYDSHVSFDAILSYRRWNIEYINICNKDLKEINDYYDKRKTLFDRY